MTAKKWEILLFDGVTTGFLFELKLGNHWLPNYYIPNKTDGKALNSLPTSLCQNAQSAALTRIATLVDRIGPCVLLAALLQRCIAPHNTWYIPRWYSRWLIHVVGLALLTATPYHTAATPCRLCQSSCSSIITITIEMQSYSIFPNCGQTPDNKPLSLQLTDKYFNTKRDAFPASRF